MVVAFGSLIIVHFNYVRQVNEVKLAEIMFYLLFRPSFCPSVCAQSINRL